MNSCSFAGRVGKDAVLRQTQNGDSVLSFSVAVDVRKGKEKSTLWIACTVWGKRAEALSQYVTAGTCIAVSGSISLRTYEGKNGTATSLDLNVQELTLLGSGNQRQEQQAAKPMRQTDPDPFKDDLEIPF